MANNSNQYQQNEQAPHSLNTNKITTYDIGNPGYDLGQAQNCGEVNPVNGIFLIHACMYTSLLYLRPIHCPLLSLGNIISLSVFIKPTVKA